MNEAEGSSPPGQTDSNPCFDFTHLDWTRDVRGQTNTTSLYRLKNEAEYESKVDVVIEHVNISKLWYGLGAGHRELKRC
jgi:hypothetical protein